MDLKRCVSFGPDRLGLAKNEVLIYDTCGICDAQYHARIVDPVGIGHGNTPKEAMLSVAETLRLAADRIEEASEKL